MSDRVLRSKVRKIEVEGGAAVAAPLTLQPASSRKQVQIPITYRKNAPATLTLTTLIKKAPTTKAQVTPTTNKKIQATPATLIKKAPVVNSSTSKKGITKDINYNNITAKVPSHIIKTKASPTTGTGSKAKALPKPKGIDKAVSLQGAVATSIPMEIIDLTDDDDAPHRYHLRRNRGRLTMHVMSEKMHLILTMEKSNCICCKIEMKEREGIMIDACLHNFCRDCLVSTIEAQDSVQINCPVDSCNGVLLEKEIKALLTPEGYEKYLEKSMILARENQFQCKTPNCEGWCEFENGKKAFLCYLCKKNNCLECQAIHVGVDCKEFQKAAAEKAKADEAAARKREEQDKKGGWEQLKTLIRVASDDDFETILQKLQSIDVFTSSVEFECPICMTDVAVGDGIILQDCLHTFCKDCLIEMVKHSEDAEVKCPHIDGNTSCINYLKPREIKAMAPADVYEKYLQRSVKLAEGAMINSFHCKTLDCPGWCEIDNEDGAEQVIKFKCPRCSKVNCLVCKVVHEGITCEDYKNRLVQNENDKLSEEAVQEMIRKGECMKCSRCSSIVMKDVGCDWIICTACKTELCWATKGPRWGPKGKGDVSGGCKCEYAKGGARCAPLCRNCH